MPFRIGSRYVQVHYNIIHWMDPGDKHEEITDTNVGMIQGNKVMIIMPA